jgi:hypothetical protein
LGLLDHMKGPTFAPVAYLSKQLDLVIKGWQPCLHALAVAALLAQEASELTFGNPPLSCPLVSPLPFQPVSLKTTTLLSHFLIVTLQACPSLNPATLLPNVTPPEHFCLESLEKLTYCQSHLSSSPLPYPEISWFIDGSSSLDSTDRR